MKSESMHMVARLQKLSKTPGRICILLTEKFWFGDLNSYYLATAHMKALVVEACTVEYICIYVAPWSCETRHLVPLYVHTCSGNDNKAQLDLTWLEYFVSYFSDENKKEIFA